MLVSAILYKEEINKKFMEYAYTDDMIYYTGCIGYGSPRIEEDDSGGIYQYAVIDNGTLIGYFQYMIDWYSSCARSFGLFSFDRKNKIIGMDVYREIKKIIYNYHIHRVEWRMVGGNPVEKHYDKFCKKISW